MKKLSFIAVLLAVLLMGCSPASNKLLGTWTTEDGLVEYTFNKKNEAIMKVAKVPVNITYTVSGKKIALSLKVLSSVETRGGSFSIENDVLTINFDDGSSLSMIKKPEEKK